MTSQVLGQTTHTQAPPSAQDTAFTSLLTGVPFRKSEDIRKVDQKLGLNKGTGQPNKHKEPPSQKTAGHSARSEVIDYWRT